MVKKLVASILLLIFLLILPSLKLTKAQTLNLETNEVAYELPYPGLLPDHPLYFLKAIRDRMLDILTLDNQKNAELYLLFSDKRANAAKFLAEKGRGDLAITTLSKAEKYSLKIPPLLKESKTKPKREFIDKVKSSNLKHKEIIEDFLKELPQGDQLRITEILKINEDVRNMLRGL